MILMALTQFILLQDDFIFFLPNESSAPDKKG